VFVSFLTDFGLQDDFVGTCHGVIARIAPEARVIDITHGIQPGRVLQGALMLANTLAYMPEGVHLAVVDPGVGTDRRPLAVRAGRGDVLVGPDNGLLQKQESVLGGVDEAVALARSPWLLQPLSATFHGRDVFAPAAAHLAAGVPAAEAGPEIDPATLVRLPDPVVTVGDGWIESEVVTVDRFGNVQLAAGGDVLAGLGPDLVINGAVRARRGATFGDVGPGDLLVFEDSAGRVAIAVNNGRAVVVLSVRPGDVVRVAERHARG